MAMAANFALALPSKRLCSGISSFQRLNSQYFHSSKSLPNFSVSMPHTTASFNALSAIQDSGVIACLRAESAELAIEAARAALDGGVTVLEIVMSNPGVFEVLESLVQYYPTKTLGVGTVLDVEDAKTAIKFGAKFLLSPAMVKGILDYASGCEALYVPGAMTPTEILLAFNAGAKLIKVLDMPILQARKRIQEFGLWHGANEYGMVYPASILGGVQYIASLKKVFPHIPLIASQGIKLDSIDEYIAQGATAVVLSDAIFDRQAMVERNFKAIHQLSQSAVLCAFGAVERERKYVR